MTDNQQKVNAEDFLVSKGYMHPSRIEHGVETSTVSLKNLLEEYAAMSAPAGEREGKSFAEIEATATKLFPLYKMARKGEGEKRSYVDGYLAGASSTTPPTGKAAGVWVKASESVPNYINGITPKEVAVRYHKDYKGKMGNYINYSGGFYSATDNCFYVKSPISKVPDRIELEAIEWLDYSGQLERNSAGEWIYGKDPLLDGFYYCKTINDFGEESKQLAKFAKEPVYAGRKWDTHYQIIAWLDESAQPSETGEGKLVEGLLAWVAKENWIAMYNSEDDIRWYKPLIGYMSPFDYTKGKSFTTSELMAEYQQYLLNNK